MVKISFQNNGNDTRDVLLGFKLGDSEFATCASTIKKMVRPRNLITNNHCDDFLKGFMRYGNDLLPVFYPHSKLGIKTGDFGRETRILIVDHEGGEVGLAVDKTIGMMNLRAKELNDGRVSSVSADYLAGIYSEEGKPDYPVLDLLSIISSDDENLKAAREESKSEADTVNVEESKPQKFESTRSELNNSELNQLKSVSDAEFSKEGVQDLNVELVAKVEPEVSNLNGISQNKSEVIESNIVTEPIGAETGIDANLLRKINRLDEKEARIEEKLDIIYDKELTLKELKNSISSQKKELEATEKEVNLRKKQVFELVDVEKKKLARDKENMMELSSMLSEEKERVSQDLAKIKAEWDDLHKQRFDLENRADLLSEKEIEIKEREQEAKSILAMRKEIENIRRDLTNKEKALFTKEAEMEHVISQKKVVAEKEKELKKIEEGLQKQAHVLESARQLFEKHKSAFAAKNVEGSLLHKKKMEELKASELYYHRLYDIAASKERTYTARLKEIEAYKLKLDKQKEEIEHHNNVLEIYEKRLSSREQELTKLENQFAFKFADTAQRKELLELRARDMRQFERNLEAKHAGHKQALDQYKEIARHYSERLIALEVQNAQLERELVAHKSNPADVPQAEILQSMPGDSGLSGYILLAMERGFERDAIYTKLQSVGWSEDHIDKAFAHLDDLKKHF